MLAPDHPSTYDDRIVDSARSTTAIASPTCTNVLCANKNSINTQPAGNSRPHVKQELRRDLSSNLQGIHPSSTTEMTFSACGARACASGWCNLPGHRSAVCSYTLAQFMLKKQKVSQSTSSKKTCPARRNNFETKYHSHPM